VTARVGRAPAAVRVFLASLFDAAIAALDPAELVTRRLRRDGRTLVFRGARGKPFRLPLQRGVIVIGAGKGAATLASAVESVAGDAVIDGVVIVPRGYERPLRRIALARGSHPVPDDQSVAATARLFACVARHPRLPVVVVLSGGASSLLVRPARGLTLADKRRTTRLLLRSGADIHEVNTVRKHLSAVKGGRLTVSLAGRKVTALIVSDVPGDDLGTIGSGPLSADPTTYADALAVLARYEVRDRVPATVVRHLERGARGLVAETPKQPPRAASLRTVLLAGNATARRGALRAARRQGVATTIEIRPPLTGTTADAARILAGRIVRSQEALRTGGAAVIVAGGETTVTVGRGAGRGGRNQELALAVASLLAGRPGWALLCAGTDGIDGPTPAAGAFADGTSARRAKRAGRSVDEALRRHDVYPLLAATGDLFSPGATGTNVADLSLALVWKTRGWRLPPAVC
jgi:glycerate 2-kinase